MRKRTPKALIILCISLLLVVSLSRNIVEWVRGATVAMLSPVWQVVADIKGKGSISPAELEVNRFSLENRRLQEEIRRLQALVIHEATISRKGGLVGGSALSAHQKRHLRALRQMLEYQFDGLSAKVIYRSPESWNSSLWINVGNADNVKIGRTIIAKDSPVVVGEAIVGVVDYVGERQARVRLITDSGLTPSVRVARDEASDRFFAEAVGKVLIGIEMYPNWLNDDFDRDIMKGLLEQCLRNCRWQVGSERFLTKGELHGSGSPLWRASGQSLKGIGFNYDFADEEGPARDLRSGKAFDGSDGEIAMLKVGDLLVTTGMDGVFPAGLVAAEIVKIYPLKEGDYFYELEAKPAAGNLDDLVDLYVLPPVGYEEVPL